MKYDNYEETLRSFPHWYDKNPYSNFSKVIRVLNKQYVDKCHKIRALSFAQKLYKPIRIHKEQKEKYKYDIIFEVSLDNLKEVNVYVNPIINDDEEILSYDECYTKEFKDDGYNNQFNFTYKGDSRIKRPSDEKIPIDSFEPYEGEIPQHTITLNVANTEGIPISDAKVIVKDITPIIPKDTFIIEVLTYDDYRWVKGFPENDEMDLFRIYQEQKSYTDYLTFEIKKQNIKNISILKNGSPIFKQDLFTDANGKQFIYHDYLANQKVKNDYDKQVIVADPKKDNYVIRVLLDDNDFQYIFDYTALELEYPNTEDYVLEYALESSVNPSEETLNTVVIRKNEKDRFSAYKTVFDGENYHFAVIEPNVRYVRHLKDVYDLLITIYDKNHRNCKEYDKQIHKRYNGFDKHNYDCFTHDYSLDMLGKFWNIPRLEFNPSIYENKCDRLNVDYYSRTYPSFNDRLTEDDYNYQQRITTYIQRYNKEYFPVLELWKNYQIWGELRNRKDILSTQDISYMQEFPYYVDSTSVEESRNKLDIVKGICNEVSINKHLWYESVLVDNLFVVPNAEYRFKCIIRSNEIIDIESDRVSLHLYYLDKKGNCHNETLIYPKLSYVERDGQDNMVYSVDEIFTVRNDAIKMDFVIESDYWFSFDNAILTKHTIVDKDAMYMATKNDYNSCVYDLSVDYTEVPTNIDFTNTQIFEKILQRSLPITHKGFLNISNSYGEEIGLCSFFGNIRLVDLCDFTNDYGADKKQYPPIEFDSFIKENCHYTLNVVFENNEPIVEGEDYVFTEIIFKQTRDGEHLNLDRELIKKEITPNSETILNHNFIPPKDSNILIVRFYTNDTEFKYKDLSIKRREPISEEELWSN